MSETKGKNGNILETNNSISIILMKCGETKAINVVGCPLKICAAQVTFA